MCFSCVVGVLSSRKSIVCVVDEIDAHSAVVVDLVESAYGTTVCDIVSVFAVVGMINEIDALGVVS